MAMHSNTTAVEEAGVWKENRRLQAMIDQMR